MSRLGDESRPSWRSASALALVVSIPVATILVVGELKRVVSSFLQILDAHPRERMVIAATNHEGMLDDALWRRFDEILHFGRPSASQLVELMELRLASVRKRGLDLAAFASEMVGFSYADAERVCLEATKAMLLRGVKEMTPDFFEAELAEQRARLALASGSADQNT